MKSKNAQDVRTRFAPSPTGTPESIHLGFVIRALWSYAYAKKHGGKFILRIEDTDQARSRKDTEEQIFSVLKKFGIIWDEGPDVGGPFAPYRQSDRLNKYREAAVKLVEKGYAYYDFDATVREKEVIKATYHTAEGRKNLKTRPKARLMDLNDAKKRVEAGEPYVVRVKIPENKKFEYFDWILKKRISFIGKEITDMILLKSDGFPTYHLAVVVDDVDMQISHVFRGQEWITSTPIHLYLYEGLGKKIPEIGHFSVILDPRTKKKFSKRDMTAMFGVQTWLTQGYIPEAILNYLMLLGWAPKNNRELFTLDEFVKSFDQEGVQKANPTFDANKLRWMNSQYLQLFSDEEFAKRVQLFVDDDIDNDLLIKIAPLVKTRIDLLSEFMNIAGFFFETPDVKINMLKKDADKHLKKAYETLGEVEEWELENINDALMSMIEKEDFKVGKFFMNFRIAITGSKVTPPINESIEILGKEETLQRIKKLI